MKIGFLGLGKLGYPVACGMAAAGCEVMGFDLVPLAMSHDRKPYKETAPDGVSDLNDWIDANPEVRENFTFGTIDEIAAWAEIVFIAVQTPHKPEYEGITRLPRDRADFDYSYLRKVVADLAAATTRELIVVVISTVLPGTMDAEIRPLLNPNMTLLYNPFFIAMGTTLRDFYYPEFILVGRDKGKKEAVMRLKMVYARCSPAPVVEMSIPSAELTKVAYNTYISQKIVFTNTIMEICHKMPGADCDEVMGALVRAHRRLISPAYMSGGMGDGGGCHPRDNIAMSFLAQCLELSHDIFEDVMKAREEQTEFLVDLAYDEAVKQPDYPIVILGKAFKPETNLIVGSPAILFNNLLHDLLYDLGDEDRKVMIVDPFVDGPAIDLALVMPAIFFIGCRHEVFRSLAYPAGSVIIDPWRYIPDLPDVTVIRVGRGRGRQ